MKEFAQLDHIPTFRRFSSTTSVKLQRKRWPFSVALMDLLVSALATWQLQSAETMGSLLQIIIVCYQRGGGGGPLINLHFSDNSQQGAVYLFIISGQFIHKFTAPVAGPAISSANLSPPAAKRL